MHLLSIAVHWLCAAYCGLALLHLTDAGTKPLQITQKPRFYGVMIGKKVGIYCMSPEQHLPSTARWYKASTFDSEKSLVRPGSRIFVRNTTETENAILILSDLQTEDQGVYFCEISQAFGAGTEVQVAKPVNLDKLLYRSRMKDALMMFQALLLAVFIAAFGFRTRTLANKEEHIYEEPEMDHIYEGLVIEACGGDQYEEIPVYTQLDGAEAPWDNTTNTTVERTTMII